MRIKVLPDVVINQIAAGEVVERPGSVVRELVDNAVDSGTSDIFVSLEAGGHSRIKVRDNGCGMSKDEAILAFERHATSKVSCLSDLVCLSSLGFRGEALASIAAVSKVQLRTRARDSEVGTLVVFRGGKLIDVQAIAWNQGTEVEVEHLFFNTPARRKFLKSPRAEVARIRTWLAHSGLARPGVRYRLVSDGDEILNLQPTSSMSERACAVFGSDLIPVSFFEGGVRVDGMVAHPAQALADSSGLVILINGRLVADKVIARAVREGYDSMLKDREYPVGYLALSLPGEDVDINVHPQKSEVRLRHAQQVFAVVRGAVLSALRSIKRPIGLGTTSHLQELLRPTTECVDVQEKSQPRESVEAYGEDSLRYQTQAMFQTSDVLGDQSHVTPQRGSLLHEGAIRYEGQKTSIEKRVASPEFRFSDLRYIGQLLQCYLVCEYGEAMVVVDMHAAHERVNFNRVRSAYEARAISTQKLLIPMQITLTEEHVVHLIEQVEVLESLGFELLQTGPTSIAVHGVPAVVSHLDCAALLRDCAAEPLSIGWKERVDEVIDHLAARIACHASVRSGDQMTRQEAYALFAQLDATEVAGACPHGRPVVAHFQRDAIERWFGRDR